MQDFSENCISITNNEKHFFFSFPSLSLQFLFPIWDSAVSSLIPSLVRHSSKLYSRTYPKQTSILSKIKWRRKWPTNTKLNVIKIHKLFFDCNIYMLILDELPRAHSVNYLWVKFNHQRKSDVVSQSIKSRIGYKNKRVAGSSFVGEMGCSSICRVWEELEKKEWNYVELRF